MYDIYCNSFLHSLFNVLYFFLCFCWYVLLYSIQTVIYFTLISTYCIHNFSVWAPSFGEFLTYWPILFRHIVLCSRYSTLLIGHSALFKLLTLRLFYLLVILLYLRYLLTDHCTYRLSFFIQDIHLIDYSSHSTLRYLLIGCALMFCLL